MSEIDTKLNRVASLLDRHNLDGLLLSHRNNFAWITAGRDNHIPNNAPTGVATCVVNSCESRLRC